MRTVKSCKSVNMSKQWEQVLACGQLSARPPGQEAQAWQGSFVMCTWPPTGDFYAFPKSLGLFPNLFILIVFIMVIL